MRCATVADIAFASSHVKRWSVTRFAFLPLSMLQHTRTRRIWHLGCDNTFFTSVADLADLSLRSSRKIFILLIKIKVRINVHKKYIFNFEKNFTVLHTWKPKSQFSNAQYLHSHMSDILDNNFLMTQWVDQTSENVYFLSYAMCTRCPQHEIIQHILLPVRAHFERR